MRRRFASRYYADAQVPLSPKAYTPEISYCLVSARVGQLGKELATCVGELPNGLRKHRMLLAGYWQVCLDKLDNQVGVDSVWGQEKPEARKMLENAADSHTSGAPK